MRRGIFLFHKSMLSVCVSVNVNACVYGFTPGIKTRTVSLHSGCQWPTKSDGNFRCRHIHVIRKSVGILLNMSYKSFAHKIWNNGERYDENER